MGCFYWDESKNGPCGALVSKNGLCATHFSASSVEKPATEIPSAVMKWTPPAIKKHMGQMNSSFNARSEYVGGAANQPHVHNYSNGGAHVKVGKEFVFLSKADGSFIQGGWDEGVAAAKQRQPHLLLAMALVLATSATAGLADTEIDKLIKALPTS